MSTAVTWANDSLISLDPKHKNAIFSYLPSQELATKVTLTCKALLQASSEMLSTDEKFCKKHALFQLGPKFAEAFFKQHQSWTIVCKTVKTVGFLFNGILQQGQFKNGLLHGLGKRINADGSEEKGLFFNGMLCGLGRKSWPKYHVVYTGNFRKGVAHGKGCVTSPNLHYLIGKFKNGILCKAKAYYTNDIVEEGIIRNGRLYKGKITYPDNTIMEGEFGENGLVNGKIIYPNKTMDEGNFCNGQLQGQGKRTYLDGTIEEGEFVKGSIPFCCIS